MNDANFNLNLEHARLLADRPGFQGALARLVLMLDPNWARMWLAAEVARGTPPAEIAKVVGEFMAVVVYATAHDVPVADKLGFINGDLGILGQFKARLESRLRAPTSNKIGVQDVVGT